MKTISAPVLTSPHELDFISHSAAQTLRIGQRLGEQLHPGAVLLLLGDLGAGKTQLARGIAQGLGSPDMVTSPSFVLINEYRTSKRGVRIYHVDLYRLDEAAEVQSIGLEELWSGRDICLIEWARRAEAYLPREYLAVELRYLDETKRRMRFTPRGTQYEQLVESFKTTTFG
ncbi:MAG: tRNA (adenosine(37)-N6)-threonylcarbamoyltransferase complex ATPase subunit type 1 TsaE [Chloroflexaceae bacterium]|nr:tRNA (adenosine(37)-N6)-threonylcarbamoyltransferase complex ATPase subunit type 1 TsaE [Chloroflexaceae bacterium]